MRTRRRGIAAAVAVAAAATVTAVPLAGTMGSEGRAPRPIVIGAAVDLTSFMAPFDSAALRAAQIRAAQINRQGGVNGRRLVIRVCNHQLRPERGRSCAASLIDQGAIAVLVTCDVEYATPATQETLNSRRLAIASCIGTDEMGPKRFGTRGRLAFSFGNAAADEGAAMAEYAYKRKRWRRALVVTDNLLVYFRDVTRAFTQRFRALGGRIVRQESFTNMQNQIPGLVSRLRNTGGAQVIVTSTTFGDWPQLVRGLRSLGVNTPIMNSWAGDGTNWWPTDPRVTNYWYVTFASIFGDDPNPAVRRIFRQMVREGRRPATGSFVTGAAAIDALVTAIKRARGSTNGAVLARQFERFRGLQTVSGRVSFSTRWHTVIGRTYRVINVQNNRGRYVGAIRVTRPANID